MDVGQDEGRWLLSGELPCLGCGYNLRGLVGPVVKCPECGHANDLRDPSPWQIKDLPLGVRQREHWPASAVLYSVAAAIPAAFGIAAARFSGRISLVVAFAAVAVAVLWVVQCWRWVRSARSAAWAVVVLVAMHVSAWAVPGGVVAMGMHAGVTLDRRWLLLSGAGFIGLVALRWVVNSADRRGQFRTDWRTYRLPHGPDS